MNKVNLAIVLVTYNREKYLRKTMPIYSKMTVLPKKIIVIDNNSSDNSIDYLRKWEKKDDGFEKIVCKTDKNLGGAGGFSFGMKIAFKDKKINYIMLADDDAMPDLNLIKNFKSEIENTHFPNDTLAFSTSRYDPDTKKISKNSIVSFRKGLLFIKYKFIKEKDLQKRYFEINILTFVGAIISTNAVEKIGFPNEDFFIYWDDIEYSHRLSSIGKIFMIPSSIYYHKVAGSKKNNLWKEYYEVRNSIYTIKKYYSRWYYFWFEFILRIKKTSFIGRILKRRSMEEMIMLKNAIRDGKKGRIMVSKQYGPGIGK